MKSVLEYSEMFIDSNTVRTFGSESTLFDEMCNFIKDSKKLSGTYSEFTTGIKASSDDKNANRRMSMTVIISRKVPGDIPDLVFKYGENELGCVEIGLSDNGANGTKELMEKKMKTPKMMRSFCGKIMADYMIDNPEKINIISYVISGSYFTTNIMKFRKGSVGLVCSSKRTKMPTVAKEDTRLLPKALKNCYSASKITKSTVEYLESIFSEEVEDKEISFLPCFEPANDSAARK